MRTSHFAKAASLSVVVVLGSFACGTARTAASPAPSTASAEVRALEFVVGDFTWSDADWSDAPGAASSKSDGSLRCTWNASGAGVDCAEEASVDGDKRNTRLAIRWDESAKLYRLAVDGQNGKSVAATGTLRDGRLVFTTLDGSGRITLERHDEGLRMLAESCQKGTCQVLSKLELEHPFVAPPNDRNA